MLANWSGGVVEYTRASYDKSVLATYMVSSGRALVTLLSGARPSARRKRATSTRDAITLRHACHMTLASGCPMMCGYGYATVGAGQPARTGPVALVGTAGRGNPIVPSTYGCNMTITRAYASRR